MKGHGSWRNSEQNAPRPSPQHTIFVRPPAVIPPRWTPWRMANSRSIATCAFSSTAGGDPGIKIHPGRLASGRCWQDHGKPWPLYPSGCPATQQGGSAEGNACRRPDSTGHRAQDGAGTAAVCRQRLIITDDGRNIEIELGLPCRYQLTEVSERLTRASALKDPLVLNLGECSGVHSTRFNFG